MILNSGIGKVPFLRLHLIWQLSFSSVDLERHVSNAKKSQLSPFSVRDMLHDGLMVILSMSGPLSVSNDSTQLEGKLRW